MENLTFLLVVKTLHVASMAIWFGLPLALSSEIRQSVKDSPAGFSPGRVDTIHRVLMIFGLVTLITGISLIFLKGGFGMIHPNIHIGFLLTLVLMGIEHGMTFRTWKNLKQSMALGDLAGAQVSATRYNTFSTAEHFLKLVILFLMVFRY